MKKIFLYITCLASFVLGIASCDDNTGVSELHVLTPAEEAELARQDSIREAQKNTINADLVLEYTADITISATLYDGVSVPIETQKIAEKFGLSEEDLLLGIADESGAPEIKGFAIEGSTGADAGTKSNTNAKWGHWWNAKGDVTAWGDDAMVFAEFNTETGAFAVGQYPGHLTDGQTIKFIECLKYNEVRIAVVITVNAHAAGQITAQVVNTQELSCNVTPRADYTADPFDFDVARTLSDLGISSLDDVTTIAVNEDGSYAQENNAGTKGYWYDMNGFAGQWGDDASVYTSLDEDEDGNPVIGIGQMPSVLEEGDVITIKYGFLANNKIEMLKITVNVVGYQDPETAPEGEPEDVEKDIKMTKAWDDTYSSVEVDVKDILRDAFKMTTYQIHRAIASGELKVFLNEVSDEAPSYTADAPGYWITADGAVGAWAESIVWCSLGNNETKLYLYGGNHPGNAVAGDVVKTKFIIVCNGAQVTFNVTYTLTAAVEE